MFRTRLGLVALIAILAAACAPTAAPSGPGPAPEQQAATSVRTLSAVLRVEPFDLTDSASSRNRLTLAMFGATLAYMDTNDVPFPVLADALPQLNSDTWRLLPDGRMETSYRLRPNLVWHDGVPLTAQDFAFTRRANTAQFDWGLSVSALSPIEHRGITDVEAQDERTVLIRWRQPYPGATHPEIKVLPRHILEPVLDQGVPEAFSSHPYWTTDHVGVGPYRLARWEQGAYLEGVAFDRFALGRPKIDRIRVTWTNDPNVTLARLLSGDAHIAVDEALKFQQALTLRQEWGRDGVILISPTNLRKLDGQHRPAFANPPSILDPRLRKATMHAIDRKAVADAMSDGDGVAAESIVPPNIALSRSAERVITKYPYDLRSTEQIMAELGFVKGADGFYTSPAEGRHSPEVLGIAEGQEGQETTVVVDYLRRAGIDARLRLAPAAQIQQSDEMKATYPAWRTNNHYTTATGTLSADRMLGSRAATVDNRWSGTNKSGWANAEHDRLFEAWSRALDRDERTQLQLEIVKITNEELPFIPLYFGSNVVAHVAALQGPQSPGLETMIHGNIHEWAWTQPNPR
jgi:peptide/nickel transport system substrate-binding protein